MNIAGLAASLSRAAGRPVLDRTGLTGFFAVNLTFATEPNSVSPLGGPPQGVSIDPVDAPSLTTAVVDQLGLRLESRREQMAVLVIDAAEPPTEQLKVHGDPQLFGVLGVLRPEVLMQHALRPTATVERPRTLRMFGALFVVGVVAVETLAQAPAFEVASIKRQNVSIPGQTIGQQGDRFVARNVTVRDLIATAYQVPSDQISGGPAWTESDRYDVEAKPVGAALWPDQLRMLQSLLADRFGLRLQRDSRDVATYDLIVAPSGVKLKPAPACRDDEKQCGGFRTAPGAAIGRHVTVAQVAALLSGRADRRVTDATGLQGSFDVELRWMPAPGQVPSGRGPDDAPPIDPSAPSLSVAIEEQLGLRFRSSRGTTDHFRITAVERPAQN